jgi:AraC-like DNA-binding protein
MQDEFAIDVRFYRLSDELSPYFTALYSFTITCPDDVLVQDQLHPEWAALRFTQRGHVPIAAITPDPITETWPLVASGPTSRAIKFGLKASRVWGLGLQPAGWARYVAAPASTVADCIVNAGEMDAFAAFHPVLDVVLASTGNSDETARQINAVLLAHPATPVAAEPLILACQEALRDPEMEDVSMLADRVGIGRRSLERLCSRYFGFPPKLLLRRQRFLRSLARFMLTRNDRGGVPSWSQSLDVQYFDHAHFVRDFRSFMGMTPTEYADAPHPILDRIMAQRMADQGAAPQTDLPTILRYRDPVAVGR